ncbi:MAG TPA: leucyl aminopeptidase family protein [Actinomycetaceae bacterium]|nr:leucyl aminopeptidase family protein [Actinomycetaceae bacterium]
MTHAAPYPPFALPERRLSLAVAESVSPEIGAAGHIVFDGEDLPAGAGISLERAEALGFTAKRDTSLVLPTAEGPVSVFLGGGARGKFSLDTVRDAAAVLARAVPLPDLAMVLPESFDDVAASAAAVEGAALARYAYRIGKEDPKASISSLTLIAAPERHSAIEEGMARGAVIVRGTKLARDLAGTPGGILTAPKLGEVATEHGAAAGLEVTVTEEAELVEMGCGGLLGVNLGSEHPPVMVKLVYRPAGEPIGRLTLVGKGIMYDAGGLALKPGDEMHATMKNDMTGAAAILGAMTTLGELGCTSQVTGYLMCTDNLPDATSMKMGDVIVMRGGKTVEVMNTDAEGRLVMADALVLANEEPVDAIVDIATLTGAAMRALGTDIAAVIGNNEAMVEQVKASAKNTDEPVWELPLARGYRSELDSEIADLRNVGGVNAGSITAALFLEEFVGETPWAHIDIAGTAQSGSAKKWRNKGTTGFGTRLLIDLALNFRKVKES